MWNTMVQRENNDMQLLRITRFKKGLVPEFNGLIAQLSPDKVLTDSQLKSILKDKNVYLLGLFDKKKLIGTASLILMRQIIGTKAMIEDLVVDERYRGRGLGERLMKELIDIGKKENVRKVALTSRPDRKAAHSLYRKLGFTIKDTNVFHLKL